LTLPERDRATLTADEGRTGMTTGRDDLDQP
jgi:hypothetical protein